MSPVSGMDPVTARDVAAKLDAQVSRLSKIVVTVDSQVVQIQRSWSGKKANDFVSWWRHQHRPALMRAQETIAGLAQSLRFNADDQERTSSSAGSGVAPATGTSAVALGGAIPPDVIDKLEPLLAALGPSTPLAALLLALLSGNLAIVPEALRAVAQDTLRKLQTNLRVFSKDGRIDGGEVIFMVGTVEMGLAAGIKAIPGLNEQLKGYGDVLDKAGEAAHMEKFKQTDAMGDWQVFLERPDVFSFGDVVYSGTKLFGNTLQMVPEPTVQGLGDGWSKGPDAARQFGYDARVYYDDPSWDSASQMTKSGMRLGAAGIEMYPMAGEKLGAAADLLNAAPDIADRIETHQVSDIPGLINDGRDLVGAASTLSK